MYVDGDRVVSSPSDLTTWAACEWAFVRRLDAKLGRIPVVDDPADAMLERTARLGDAHELRYLDTLRERYVVVEFDRPDRADYAAAARAAEDAMRAGVDVLYQATFFDGSFIGFSDFLVKNDAGAYEVYDTKLARHAKIPALLQLAAYADQITALGGIDVGEQVHLVLGDGSRSTHELATISPVYRVQHERLRSVLDERLHADAAVEWGDPRFTACGRCAACSAQVDEHRDLVLVAGMRLDQRSRLNTAGIRSIDQLASSTGPVPGVGAATLARLRGQARVQLDSRPGLPAVEVHDASAFRAIPTPDDGDIFFDFEGDPLYTEGDGHEWGLDYLFGLVESDGTFRSFWAHDFAGERQALVEFLDYLAERRAAHPRMHVYHYAAYERTHLLSLAARHGVGEDQVDDLLRDGVLIDLYPVVRQALVVGSRSYSLKKLEPLYMGDELRDGDVTNAADSISAYVDARAVAASGDTVEGQRMLDEVRDYNAYDCRSTLKLRDWLLGLDADHRDEQGRRHEGGLAGLDVDDRAADAADAVAAQLDERVLREPHPVVTGLLGYLGDVHPLERDADQTAVALAASAIDYHRREAKTFWQDHFDRLRSPIDDWADVRDVFVVEQAQVEREWSKLPRARAFSREVLLRGRLAPGSRLAIGASPYAVYDEPSPDAVPSPGLGLRGATAKTSILEVGGDDDGVDVLLLERAATEDDTYAATPTALTPAAPPRASPQPEAIAEWGQRILDSLPELPADAALDLLRRRPPRSRSGARLAPVVDGDTVTAVTDSLLDLDRSYLAVQGPPGTGKTYLGSHVIARLVAEHGWSVGVVGQSHAVVENVLDAVVTAGVPADRVGKVPKSGASADALEAASWRALATGDVASFVGQPAGVVFGATAWGFANGDRIARRSLDLLVVDEAGQFSLASTIASSVAAERLLLLGDPQQLPQVSQGSHPEPVDESALGWLADGHDVLPSEFGYFLARTWRMHPALCEPVSRLSYAGALQSRASDERLLVGIEPGLHVVPVEHAGDTTSSEVEAERVVELTRSLIGRSWTDRGETRPLLDSDVIVVAPYNAQTVLLRERLDAAGFTGTPVGTVDLFQGQEAVVAIVSLAASSAADLPRGVEFLLMPNRLNVALSRAQWAAYLVHSPALATGLPTSIAGLELLSGFIALTGAAAGTAN